MNPITRQMTRAYIATTAAVSRTIDRMRSNDRGQGTLEYIGITIAVVVLVGLLVKVFNDAGVLNKMKEVFKGAIEDVGKVGETNAPAPKPT